MKINSEIIAETLSPFNWTLAPDQIYRNLDQQLEFKCPKGHSTFSTWKKMRSAAEKQKLLCQVCDEEILQKKQQQLSSAFESDIVPPKKDKRILGLDQATHTTGYCIMEGQKIIKIGIFKASNSSNEIDRDCQIKYWLNDLIKLWQIDHVGLEGIQMEHGDVTTYAMLARLQGILMAAMHKRQISYEVIPVATWRNFSGVKGKSRLDRKQYMQNLIKKEYGLDLTDDVCDAVGIARYAFNNNNKYKVEIW